MWCNYTVWPTVIIQNEKKKKKTVQNLCFTCKYWNPRRVKVFLCKSFFVWVSIFYKNRMKPFCTQKFIHRKKILLNCAEKKVLLLVPRWNVYCTWPESLFNNYWLVMSRLWWPPVLLLSPAGLFPSPRSALPETPYLSSKLKVQYNKKGMKLFTLCKL